MQWQQRKKISTVFSTTSRKIGKRRYMGTFSVSEWLKTVENSKNSVSARVFFPQIVENEVESLDFRQKTGKTDRNSMKNGNDF